MAVVMDQHGGTAGLVTIEDLFEEVVGEIDEGIPTAPAILKGAEGQATVAVTVPLDELGRHFDLDLMHEDVDSVSGLILAMLGRTPRIGDVVEYDRVRFEVGGGKYRLIASFEFRRQIVFVKFVGTHAEYDAIDALTVARF